MKWLRYGVLGVFIIMMVAGLNSLAILLAPYSAYGRIASSLLHQSGNGETTCWRTSPNEWIVMLFMR